MTDAPLYICPDQHEWEDHSEIEAPLANIKCPHCGQTAIQFSRARPANRWSVQPLRTLEADVPKEPRDG